MPQLTFEQEQAVKRREGALLLTAGAGSGKSTVLVERFVRAVRDDGAAPGRILAITFTERAAGELRERIRARLIEIAERDAAREAEEAFVTTFHGFCARLLRAHSLQAGLDPRFWVCDEGLASRLALLAFSDALHRFQAERSQAAVDLVASYGVDALQQIVLDAHRQLRSQGQTEPRLPRVSALARDLKAQHEGSQARSLDPESEPCDLQARRAVELIDDLLARYGAAYQARKQARRALDFDDLELRARDLLREHEDVRGAWSERLQMLMVDEFQDTNPRQLELLELLERDNLFTVGDQLQSIYGFRHADVRLFEERRQRLSKQGAALALTHNFRSRPAILAAVQRVFGQRLGARYMPLNAAREAHQTDQTRAGDGPRLPLKQPCVELLLTDCAGWKRADGPDGAAPWRVAEAQLLAGRVGELVADGQARAGEVVVLLRALSDMSLYESALNAAGLLTHAAIGDFWSHRQVCELLAYLRALCNPLDELALYGTLASPFAGLSSDALALLAGVARERGCGAWEAIAQDGQRLHALLPARDSERLRRFGGWFARERSSAAFRPLADLPRRAMRACGYERYVLSLPSGRRRLANVRKLLAAARSFEAREGRDLRAFLDHVAHLERARAGREPEAPVPDAHVDAVRLMSIHSAKGLEFPVVCVADLGRSPTLAVSDLLVDPDGRIGLRLARLGEPEPSPALDFAELSEQSRLAQQEEEDRILYVAMTRARERLILSGATDFERWPAPRQGGPPIRWVAPALVPQIGSLAHSGDAIAEVCVQDGLDVRCTLSRAGDERSPASPPADPPGLEHEPVVAYLPDEAPLTLASSTAPIRVLRQVPLADPDATVSYSSLAELERCGYRYYLERVLHMGERRIAVDDPHAAGLKARARGTIVHMLLEEIDFAAPTAPTAGDVARAAARIGVRISAAEREQIVSLVQGALESELSRRIARARHLEREHPFAFSLGCEQPLVTGVLDLLVYEPDGSILVVDYKSDSLAGGQDPMGLTSDTLAGGQDPMGLASDTLADGQDPMGLVSDSLADGQDLEELAAGEYGVQRLLYALAALEAGAELVNVAHWFLQRPSEPVFASFQRGAREELRALLLARLDRLRARGFAVADHPHRGICHTCPGRDTLCSWGQTHTRRERLPPLGSQTRVATLTS